MKKKIIRVLKTNKIFVPILFIIDFILLFIDILAVIQIRKRRQIENKICIIKLDKLGDYILVRNFFHKLRKSEKFSNCHLTFIGNIEIKPFVDYLDQDLWDNIIWVDIYKLSSNIFYRYKISSKIHSEAFEISINPTYARVLVLDDYITYVTRAKIRIGQTAHLINIKKWESAFGDKLYTNLINVSDEIIFEYERNRKFFEYILEKTLLNVQLKIEGPYSGDKLDENYVIVIPGAGDNFRQWPFQKFALVVDWLIRDKNKSVILCGAPSEKQVGKELVSQSKYPTKIINKIGVLSIPELLKTFNQAEFIISNEVGAVHICAALDKTVFCISIANQFSKFTEYPERMKKNIHYIYPDEIYEMMPDRELIAKRFDHKSDLSINSISVERVKQSIFL